jgi:AAT family amino acid transporter
MEMEKTEQVQKLEKGLKSRHIQLIAIGGAIGTGLFYGSAFAISLAGPSLVLGYFIGGLFVFFIMRSLGELSVDEPSAGSFSYYATRELGPLWGFLSGWTYWYVFTSALMAEIVAIGVYINFWLPNFPMWATGLIFLVFLTAVNLIHVSAYGEFEFWFAIIKVAAIIVMIVFGLLIILFGVANAGKAIGFGNLVKYGGFFPNGGYGFLLSLIFVTFAFGGVEMTGITAGEAKDPDTTIPKAVNATFWRILVFYVGAILVIVSLYPWDQIGELGSPFVLVFSKFGIPAAASVINFVVLTAAASALNSVLYGSARITYNLGLTGNGPKLFTKINKSNVPSYGILLTAVVGAIAIPMAAFLPQAFTIITSFTTVGILWGWGTILVAQYAFRRRKIKEGTAGSVKFQNPLTPFSNFFTLAYLVLVLVLLGVYEGTRIALFIFPPWIILLLILYQFTSAKKSRAASKI